MQMDSFSEMNGEQLRSYLSKYGVQGLNNKNRSTLRKIARTMSEKKGMQLMAEVVDYICSFTDARSGMALLRTRSDWLVPESVNTLRDRRRIENTDEISELVVDRLIMRNDKKRARLQELLARGGYIVDIQIRARLLKQIIGSYPELLDVFLNPGNNVTEIRYPELSLPQEPGYSGLLIVFHTIHKHTMIDMLQLLLTKGGMNMNDTSSTYGTTLLMHACYMMTGGLECIEYLLQNGADPNIVSRNGRTALTNVLYNPRRSTKSIELKAGIIKLLLKYGANPDRGTPSARVVIGRDAWHFELLTLFE